MGSLEPESTEQVISDKVPGKGSGGNREVHGVRNQAVRNRRQLGKKEEDAAREALGIGGVLDMWMGEPQKVHEVSATPDYQVKTRILKII